MFDQEYREDLVSFFLRIIKHHLLVFLNSLLFLYFGQFLAMLLSLLSSFVVVLFLLLNDGLDASLVFAMGESAPLRAYPLDRFDA